MIHDLNHLIKTANRFPYTANFMLVCVRNNKIEEIKMLKDKVNTCIVLLYIKNIKISLEK